MFSGSFIDPLVSKETPSLQPELFQGSEQLFCRWDSSWGCCKTQFSISEAWISGTVWSENTCHGLEDKVEYYEVRGTLIKHEFWCLKSIKSISLLSGSVIHRKLHDNKITFASFRELPILVSVVEIFFLSVLTAKLAPLYRQCKWRTFPSLSSHLPVCSVSGEGHGKCTGPPREWPWLPFVLPVPLCTCSCEWVTGALCDTHRSLHSALCNCLNNFLSAGNEASHFVIGAIQNEPFQI